MLFVVKRGSCFDTVSKEQFRRHWNGWAKRLEVADEMISILGDGAHWIWDAATLTFAKRDEVLDVYHGLENISNCGQVEGTCKNLIGKRLKQTGVRWRVRRVNNMATLCAVLYGKQWKAYWNYAK